MEILKHNTALINNALCQTFLKSIFHSVLNLIFNIFRLRKMCHQCFISSILTLTYLHDLMSLMMITGWRKLSSHQQLLCCGLCVLSSLKTDLIREIMTRWKQNRNSITAPNKLNSNNFLFSKIFCFLFDVLLSSIKLGIRRLPIN